MGLGFPGQGREVRVGIRTRGALDAAAIGVSPLGNHGRRLKLESVPSPTT